MTPAGVRALTVLHREGIRVNLTLVFSPSQALIVAKAGAYFVSPFLGRLDDISQDGLGLLREIVTIYRNYNFPTEVLARQSASPAARRRSCQDRRAHRHNAVQGIRAVVQAFADRSRAGVVPEGLGESTRDSGGDYGARSA